MLQKYGDEITPLPLLAQGLHFVA